MKQRGKEYLKNDWREDVQLPSKFEQHLLVVLDMFTELESVSDGRLGHIYA